MLKFQGLAEARRIFQNFSSRRRRQIWGCNLLESVSMLEGSMFGMSTSLLSKYSKFMELMFAENMIY